MLGDSLIVPLLEILTGVAQLVPASLEIASIFFASLRLDWEIPVTDSIRMQADASVKNRTHLFFMSLLL
jgi:hypothetical protein